MSIGSTKHYLPTILPADGNMAKGRSLLSKLLQEYYQVVQNTYYRL